MTTSRLDPSLDLSTSRARFHETILCNDATVSIFLPNMRNSSPVDAPFPRIRQTLLAATLLRPDRWWYLSDLARHLAVPPSSLQRELAALVDARNLSSTFAVFFGYAAGASP